MKSDVNLLLTELRHTIDEYTNATGFLQIQLYSVIMSKIDDISECIRGMINNDKD